MLLTRSPLVYPRKGLTARLACVKHAASVRPEPGSNSPKMLLDTLNPWQNQTLAFGIHSKKPKSTGLHIIRHALLAFVDTLLSSQRTHAPDPRPQTMARRPKRHPHTTIHKTLGFRAPTLPPAGGSLVRDPVPASFPGAFRLFVGPVSR